MSSRSSVSSFKDKKKKGEKIVMLTAYDCFLAKMVDESGIDGILVGDSLGMVILGDDSTTKVTMEDMIRHSRAVSRGVKNAVVIGDMPHKSFDDPKIAEKNAKRFVGEALCDAVKLEGEPYDAVNAIIKAGIPVLGHLGLTPQTATEFKVQAKDAKSAKDIIDASLRLENCGCFALILECIPKEIAQVITSKLSIPTIGIGAGPYCDGQILVLNDILGLYDKFMPKFAKRYADLGKLAKDAILKYKDEVKTKEFPKIENSFTIKQEELDKIK